MNKHEISWSAVESLSIRLAQQIRLSVNSGAVFCNHADPRVKLFPIPRGGLFAAQAIASRCPGDFLIVEQVNDADVFIDDLIDSGHTMAKWQSIRGLPFFALITKEQGDPWYEFPWERAASETGPEENVKRLLQYIGENPGREGLIETPKRVIKSYSELFGGYSADIKALMTVFEDVQCDQMVLVKDIEFQSTCEHHMLPFIGKAHIAYVPEKKVIGVSKLARILDVYAKRLQIQERIGGQVTKALMDHLQPKGAACVIEAKHLCMVCRGVQKQHSLMVTSSLQGCFLEPACRSEFFSMIH